MFRSYFKKFTEKNLQLEVVVECPDDDEKTGTVVDTIVHPLDYIPQGEIVYQKETI